MASRPPVWRRPAGITLVGLAVLGKCNGLVVRRLPSFTEATGLQRARVQGSYLTGATGSQPSDNEAEAPRVEGLWRLFSEPTQKNPFAEIPELVTFMKRFDIPSVHGTRRYLPCSDELCYALIAGNAGGGVSRRRVCLTT